MMLKRTLLTALAAVATLAFAASAQAAYLNLGTTNTSNATTTLTGTPAGAELLVRNTNALPSASAFALYGLSTATSPTASAAGVRGANSSTNNHGYGVWGSQAGSGTGVYGYTPAGTGVWGNTSSGTGVRGSSSSGPGVLGQHLATTGTAPGVSASTNSNSPYATALLATADSSPQGVAVQANAGAPGGVAVQANASASAGIGVKANASDTNGNGVWGEGGNIGVYGRSNGGQAGVYGLGGYAGVTGSGTVGVVASGTPGPGVDAISHGGQRANAAVRADNANTTDGMAGYFTNSSAFATGHFANAGSGQVLYLQNNGGPFIQAVNHTESDTKFKVDSAGNVTADGTYSTPAADVAEHVSTSRALQPGDVVVIDRTRANHYRLASRPNSTLVAGVVSTRPGVTLGSAGKGRPPLAMTGTVPVKVSAANGAIRPGDLLVSSLTPGHAMRAGTHPAVGTVIGKALGFLARGTGKVRMLVMLR
jgi:hypothetical protein